MGGGYKKINPGQPLTAKYIDKNLVRGPMRGAQYSGNFDKRQFPQGVAVDSPETRNVSPSSVYFRMAEIQDIFEDYLDVKMINGGVADGATFSVAKHYLMQQTPFDGQTVTYADGTSITYTADATDPEYKRNHNDGSENADFVVTPNWFVGEQIIICRVPCWIGETAYSWMEVTPGRFWARVA